MTVDKRNDKYIAAAVTFAVTMLLLIFLYFGGLDFDSSLLARNPKPEIETLTMDEELFIEPEIVQDLGEPDAVNHDSPAPMIKGEPKKAETENTKLVVPGKNPKPAPAEPKKISQKKESPVKSSEPSKTDKEKKEVTSKLAGKFSPHNGAESGKSGASGAGGAGIGIAGSVSGRTFKGCPKPSVELQNKVVVEVRVTINAAGRVTSATARSKRGNPSAAILRACEQAAKGARWNEDRDTPSARGSITFTITPR